MSCYAKHPDTPGIECWHGPGHAGDHGKEGRRWPNADDPLQVELAALRNVADAAEEYVVEYRKGERQIDFFVALVHALKDAGR